MYNDKIWYEKEPSKMTEEEAKQAVAYWKGRFESELGKTTQPCPLEHYPPTSSQPSPNKHFHNGTPCYQNPCIYC